MRCVHLAHSKLSETRSFIIPDWNCLCSTEERAKVQEGKFSWLESQGSFLTMLTNFFLCTTWRKYVRLSVPKPRESESSSPTGTRNPVCVYGGEGEEG